MDTSLKRCRKRCYAHETILNSEMQIKTTMRCYLIPSILAKIEKTPSADEDEEQKEVSHAAGWGRKCQHLGKRL